MRLVEIQLELPEIDVPLDVARLLKRARDLADEFDTRWAASTPAFVVSDFELVFRALAEIADRRLAAGMRFIEWGSGLGVVTCLADHLGLDAAGIEIEPKLVTLAEKLAKEFDIAASFACGSFVPAGAERRLETAGDVTWLTTTGPDGYDELELDPDDFDIVFAYPWPGEEQVIFDLFADCAAVGALLLTYHGQDGMRLQRKVAR